MQAGHEMVSFSGDVITFFFTKGERQTMAFVGPSQLVGNVPVSPVLGDVSRLHHVRSRYSASSLFLQNSCNFLLAGLYLATIIAYIFLIIL